MKSTLKVAVLLIVLTSLVILIVLNPSFLVLALVGGITFAGWSLWNNIGTPPPVNKPQDDDFSDPYDSLEDDIRHHDYGYPGFGSDDEDEHHR